MSNDLVSQQLSMPGNQMAQLEPISSKLDAPMSMGLMGFVTNESLQHQIPSSMPIGQMGSLANDLGSQFSLMPNQQVVNIESQTYTQLPQHQQGGNFESQSYIQLPQQYLLSNKPVGEITPTMLDSLRPHQLPTLNKRKTPMEPISPNSVPQKLSSPNKRVAQMEHRPWLQPVSAPSKRPVHMQLGPNSPGSQPSSASNKRAIPNKTGPSASRNQPAQMRQSQKVQTESFESVRSKMRESLAGALALVSQQQGENAMAEKNSNGEAAGSPGKRDEGSHPVETNSGNSDAVHSVSAESQGTLLSNQGNSADGNNSDATQTMQYDGQQLQSSSLLPYEDVPFSDYIFASDELLQGNGLSWVLEPAMDVTKKNEFEMEGKHISDDENLGKDNLGQSLPSPEELACQIEAELFKLFGGVNKKYKEKGRSLLFNLKDRNNPELRERVASGEIPPDRLCSMSAEELASKELSEWRQAKAEELAQMVVLPDVEVDIRRLVRKTHKGEFQVEVEQTDASSVEVSAGTTVAQRPKTDAKQAPMKGKTVRKKDESYTAGVAKEAPRTGKTVGKEDDSGSAGEKNNLEDPNLTITIPSGEGPDPMQGLMGEDEMKDADFLPPIVSLDEFMQSLDSEPPFENLPDDAGKATPISDKDDSDTRSDSKSSGRASPDTPDTMPAKHGNIDSSNLKSDSDVKPNDAPTKTETVASAASLKGEHAWEGMLQLNISSMTPVVCLFKSGEKTSTKDWPSPLEIKGRVRLDAFEKFLQDLPMSRSRAVMVVHFVCKEGSAESERGSLVEAADSYILDGRVGFAEATSGVEIYFCPPYTKTLEVLTKILPKDQPHPLNAIDNGLIGVVVWRRAQFISPNSTSNHKHIPKRQQHFTFTSSTRRPHEKDDAIAITNMNTTANSSSKPTTSMTRVGPPPHSRPPPDDDDDDDDVPPGFGPAASRDEDDLPEFNFSGGSNPSGPKYPTGYQSQLLGAIPSHLHSQTSSSSRPVDQMRELIQKYGQPNTNAPAGVGVPMQRWNDDDDDIPEWQPQTSQVQPPQSVVQRFQQTPMHAPQHQALPTMHVLAQPGNWRAPPSGSPSPGQPFVNRPQFHGANVGTGQPAWRNDAPNSRRF